MHIYLSQLNPEELSSPTPSSSFSISFTLFLVLTSLGSGRPFSDQKGLEWIPCGVHQLLSIISLVESLWSDARKLGFPRATLRSLVHPFLLLQGARYQETIMLIQQQQLLFFSIPQKTHVTWHDLKIQTSTQYTFGSRVLSFLPYLVFWPKPNA